MRATNGLYLKLCSAIDGDWEITKKLKFRRMRLKIVKICSMVMVIVMVMAMAMVVHL